MGIMIHVDPLQLENSAGHIEMKSSEYDSSYQRLFQNVEAMQAAWQGKDNQAFTAQIQNFQKDFKQMSALMKEYAVFLKNSAKIYRETQDERVMQARHLYR